MPAIKKKKLQFVKKRIVDQDTFLNKINFSLLKFASLFLQNTVSYSSLKQYYLINACLCGQERATRSKNVRNRSVALWRPRRSS